MSAFMYILCSRSGNALYVGVARNLRQRVEQHRAGCGSVHTARYRITRLVYFEPHAALEDAIVRERRIKRWRRAWKDELIASQNPTWRDLSNDIPY